MPIGTRVKTNQPPRLGRPEGSAADHAIARTTTEYRSAKSAANAIHAIATIALSESAARGDPATPFRTAWRAVVQSGVSISPSKVTDASMSSRNAVIVGDTGRSARSPTAKG